MVCVDELVALLLESLVCGLVLVGGESDRSTIW